MSENKKSGFAAQIFVAIVVALAAGGSAPWWWNKIFSGAEEVIVDAADISKPKEFTQQTSDFPEGSKRVYFANFSEWPKKKTKNGTITLSSTNSYVIQPFSNSWVGPGRSIEIPSINGDYVFDVWFRLHEELPTALNFNLTGGGVEAPSIKLYLSFWEKDKTTYSITKDLVRSGNGLPIPYVVRSESVASREKLPVSGFKSHNWIKGGKLTIKREGGNIQLFVNDKFIKQFSASLFSVKKISVGAAFESKVIISSIEARVRR